MNTLDIETYNSNLYDLKEILFQILEIQGDYKYIFEKEINHNIKQILILYKKCYQQIQK